MSIFYGGNDLCSYCLHEQEFSAEMMEKHLRTIMRELWDIPRVIVSIVGQFHLEMLRQVGTDDFTCQAMHTLECPCSENGFFNNSDFDKIVKAYQQVQFKFQVCFYNILSLQIYCKELRRVGTRRLHVGRAGWLREHCHCAEDCKKRFYNEKNDLFRATAK